MIKAWNVKGKSFDINITPSVMMFYHLKECAEQRIQLTKYFRETFRSLNEMYLSFMDPNGEIINFQFLAPDRPDPHQVMHQIYFKHNGEKRELVFENPSFNMFTRFITSEDGRDMIPVVEKSEWRTFGRRKDMKMNWSQVLRDFIEDMKKETNEKVVLLHRHELLHKIVRDQHCPAPTPIIKDERPVIDISGGPIMKVRKNRRREYSSYDFDFEDLDVDF